MRRYRLSMEQRNFLESEFQKNQNWDTEKTYELSRQMGLGRIQIYKWGYERKKKEQQKSSQASECK